MQKNKEEKQESKLANIIGTILIIICIPLLIVFLTIAVKANINHDKLPDFMGYKPLICASNSMSNIFEVGDLTITKEVEENELQKGDIITFWNTEHDTVITHRIEEITTNEEGKKVYVTKGDMNNEIDEEVVEFNQVEGEYIGHIKYIGNLILWIQKPTGLIVAFLIPVLICAIVYRHNLKRKEIKSKRTEKLLKRIEEKQKKNR